LADGTLYIASADGTLTAIEAPPAVTAPLVSLEITGPVQVVESSSASYQARAHYGDGSVVERTLLAEWSVEPDRFAAIDGPGQLVTRELIEPTHDVLVKARYSERGQTVEGQLAVRLVIGVTPLRLVQRNLQAAIQIKLGTLEELDAALERERASLEVLLAQPSTPPIVRARARVTLAICREEEARRDIERSIDDLTWSGARSGSAAADRVPPGRRSGQDCSNLSVPDAESVGPPPRP
jgi:hypothetical protein